MAAVVVMDQPGLLLWLPSSLLAATSCCWGLDEVGFNW